jgi:hypothetical protein
MNCLFFQSEGSAATDQDSRTGEILAGRAKEMAPYHWRSTFLKRDNRPSELPTVRNCAMAAKALLADGFWHTEVVKVIIADYGSGRSETHD